MTPKKFRRQRLAAILAEPSRAVEAVVAFCFVLTPGVALLLTRLEIPPAAMVYLRALHLTEPVISVLLILLGLAQFYGTATDWWTYRGRVAWAIWTLCIFVGAGYVWGGIYQRGFALSLLLGLIEAEGFIGWRCWHQAHTGNRHAGAAALA